MDKSYRSGDERTNANERFRIPNANQVYAMADGTAALPFYSWNAESNTGMFRAGDNGLGFSTAGTERLRIPKTNQVYAMANGTAEEPFYSWNANPNLGMYRGGNNILAFSTNGEERMRINAAGNVGIGGAANPTQRLHVDGNMRLQGAFMPNNQAGTKNQVLYSQAQNQAPVWGVIFDEEVYDDTNIW